ncbi:MAG: MCE family protein [Phycisphaerales bacterium]|nr:MCE family protein [Phycisphaerales bacterium]
MTGPNQPAPEGTPASGATALPQARIESGRSLWWIVPLIAIGVSVWLGWSAWTQRGVPIQVDFDHAHGLKTGDPLRYRGVDVGMVRRIEILDDGRVRVTVGVDQAVELLARGGSRFWLVRPEVGFDRIAGLDTLVGARYVAVLPGNGPPQAQFTGLADQPVVESVDSDDLEILVEAETRGSLAAGSPVTYRGVTVGTVLSVGLAPDAVGIEARVLIRSPFTSLVRAGTVFWDSGGMLMEGGLLSGMRLQLESITGLVTGSLALAVPTDPGPPRAEGARFALVPEPKGWASWTPRIPIGIPRLPEDWIPPRPVRGELAWRRSGLLGSREQRSGWALLTEAGILMPASLGTAPADARSDSVSLEVGGRTIPTTVVTVRGGLAVATTTDVAGAWPTSRLRAALAPEDCLVLRDASVAALPLPSLRLQADGNRWRIDPSVPIDPSLHGACVVAQRDGAVVGLVVVEPDEPATVALVAPVLEGR